MPKNTRKLNIVVAVRDQTKKKLGVIEGRIKSFAAKTGAAMARVGAAITTAIGGALKAALAVAAVALASFVALVKREFAKIDELAKTAFRFGIAIENIRGLALAAKTAGLSLSELNTVLRDTSRRVSEAAKGTGEAQDAIKELELDAKRLNMMPVTDQLDVILKALEDVDNQNDRIRLSNKVMGESGVKALTLIGSSLRQNIFETELFGTKLNTEIATNVQRANDEFTKMKEALRGIVQIAVGTVAPVLERIFKFIKQQLISIRFTIEAIPLTVERELLKIKKMFFDLSADLMSTPLGEVLFGKTNAPLLQFTAEGVQKEIDRINKQINDLTRLPGNLQIPGLDAGGGETPGRRGPTPGPSIVGGRLLTGAAQSNAERLASIADAHKKEQAQQAARQLKATQELQELMRQAVRNPSNDLGGLLRRP